eukprot:10023152-Alexandrium_andersonii.AAC.1
MLFVFVVGVCLCVECVLIGVIASLQQDGHFSARTRNEAHSDTDPAFVSALMRAIPRVVGYSSGCRAARS